MSRLPCECGMWTFWDKHWGKLCVYCCLLLYDVFQSVCILVQTYCYEKFVIFDIRFGSMYMFIVYATGTLDRQFSKCIYYAIFRIYIKCLTKVYHNGNIIATKAKTPRPREETLIYYTYYYYYLLNMNICVCKVCLEFQFQFIVK